MQKRLAWAAPAAAAAALVAASQPWASSRPVDPRVPKLEHRVARLEKLVKRLAAHEPELAVTRIQGPPIPLAASGDTVVDSSPCPVTATLVGGAWAGATAVASRPNGDRWEVVFANPGPGATGSVTVLCARAS